jgi:hypothetical protein
MLLPPFFAYQAANCEHGREEVCRCRCGGKLHGAKRAGLGFSPTEYYLLPADDRHHVEPLSGVHQLAFDDLPFILGTIGIRLVAAESSPLEPLPDPDIRPQEAGGAPCSAE